MEYLDNYQTPQQEFITLSNKRKINYIYTFVQTRQGSRTKTEYKHLSVKEAQALVNKYDNGYFTFDSGANCLTINDKIGISKYITIEFYCVGVKLNEQYNKVNADNVEPITVPRFNH